MVRFKPHVHRPSEERWRSAHRVGRRFEWTVRAALEEGLAREPYWKVFLVRTDVREDVVERVAIEHRKDECHSTAAVMIGLNTQIHPHQFDTKRFYM